MLTTNLIPRKVLFMYVRLFSIALTPALSASSFFAASHAQACTQAQVMKTIHQNKAYQEFSYASNYAGEQKGPTLKKNQNTDQYLFWVEKDGTTYPAIVTYASGTCRAGKAVIKTKQGE